MSPPAPVRPFVIINPAGLYYAGSVRTPWADNFTPALSSAFVYSWATAWKEIKNAPEAFAGCVAIELPAAPVL
jgi:hypothetical protein